MGTAAGLVHPGSIALTLHAPLPPGDPGDWRPPSLTPSLPSGLALPCSLPPLPAALESLASALASLPPHEAETYEDEASALSALRDLLAPAHPPAHVPPAPKEGEAAEPGQAAGARGDHVSLEDAAAAAGQEPVTLSLRAPGTRGRTPGDDSNRADAGQQAGAAAPVLALGLPAPPAAQ